MKVVCIVGARLNSSRLPRKHLLDLAGRPLIEQLFLRLESIPEITGRVLATTADGYNQPLVEWARRSGRDVFAFHGDVNDLVGRVDAVVRRYRADMVVYCCGDSPLIEPDTVSRLIRALLEHPDAERAALKPLPNGKNHIHEGFAVYSRALWDRIAAVSVAPHEREHVGSVLRDSNKIQTRTRHIPDPPIFSELNHRISVDTQADYRFMSEVYRRWYAANPPESIVSLAWAVKQMLEDTALTAINDHVRQKTIHDITRRVVIITQAGAAIGLGHLRRMLRLAEALKERHSLNVHIIISGEERDIRELRSVSHQWLDGDSTTDAIEAVCLAQNPDAVVLDARQDKLSCSLQPLLQRLSERDIPRIAVDGLFELAEHIDLYHVPSFYCGPELVRTLGAKLTYGWGEYLLPDPPPRNPRANPERLLVMTGAADPTGLCEHLPERLERTLHAYMRITWIQGPYAAPPRLPDRQKHEWRVLQNPNNLPEIMADTDLALVVHGVSLFELLKQGVPCVAFDPYLRIGADEWSALARAGAVTLADNATVAVECVGQLLDDWPRALAMGAEAARRLAGDGSANLAARIAAAVHGKTDSGLTGEA
uniref:Spore coat polysaccharide biosynthesis protein SpsF, cytidylyltransferase family n=1 Tax=Candidatus Kentrum sp. DK TaxID=2126562 RepID=A0A450TJW7_9GAMM|nr:MAG: Spore coat polysaccharide biosynthesis protein SpsF, cytidylyltransferase family [Candidatus Kentron sp. DK]